MFTGIVSDVGTVVSAAPRDRLRRIEIACAYDAATIALGASIAVNGACLTVVARAAQDAGALFAVEAGPETLALTTAGDWAPGTRVNLERPLRAGDELGGHLVQGHVDGIARIAAREAAGDAVRFDFDAPDALARFIAVKGSVALDGTSLTVNAVAGARFSCVLIPHTLSATIWGERRAGDAVNLEIDLLARYLARLLESR